jgi:hypothetical protein
VNSGAFRPHGTFFSFRDKCSLAQTTLLLHQCSGFVEMGPAFRFANNASALVQVQHSAFLRPGGGLSPRDGAAEQPGLIYLAGNAPLRFEGTQNLYYNLNALLETKAEGIVTKAEDFQKYILKSRGFDTNSLDLTVSPLQHPNPLATLAPIGFQLKPPYFRDYGLQNDWTGSRMPLPPASVAKAIKKIVDAEDNNQTIGVFSNLGVALNGAVDGDVIWVKHGEKSNEVVVPPVALKPGITVTVKPFDEHFQPILVMDPSFEEKNSYLFKVQKSKLHFKQMQFLLAPVPGFEMRSAVEMGEAAHCVFENCTFSLRPSGDGKLNVATFFDQGVMMKMDAPASSPPKVEFHECFIRGKGDLVSLRGCRKLNVEMTNSLVALDGSLLDIRATNKEMAMDQGVRWNMARSSIFTNKALFAFQFESSKGLTRTSAFVKDCLLASLSLNQSVPLVLPELSKEEFRKYLDWEGERNFYANFDSNGDNLRDWKEQVGEMKLESGKLTFSPKLDEEALRSLWNAPVELFKPASPTQEAMIKGFGLPTDTEKLLLLPLPPKASDEP